MAQYTPSVDDPSGDEKKAEAQVVYWMEQINAALTREEDWRKEATRVTAIFEGKKGDSTPYNILYTNTETMAPALYNSTPLPIVKRRFNDEDPLGKLASEAGERTLKYLTDDGMSEHATFDELLTSAVLEALVPGRGTTRFKYYPKISTHMAPAPAMGEGEDELAQKSLTYEKVDSETVCGEEVPWDRFLHGYGKKWKDVPWVAFYHEMDRDELIELAGETLGRAVPLDNARLRVKAPGQDDGDSESKRGMAPVKVAPVWEIWDKSSLSVIFVTECFEDSLLKSVPDPLKLTNFFPCPKPLLLTQKISSLIPVPLYTFYERQAKELNTITLRISKIVEALKVRGMYDQTVQGLDRVLDADDNTLIPAENVAALMAQGNALEKAIWLFPIDKLVGVLQQLYLQREQIKSIIFEITGIADIMRGSSQASETLGAQQLKTQWGGLRLKRAQKLVAAYARDCLRIMEEIAMTKFSSETLQKMTGLPYPTQGQKQQLAAVAQQTAQTGQPVPPELQAALQGPSFDDVQKLLANDVSRSFRVDIETNSTIDAEATQDKQDISEVLTALNQFLQGVSPLIESGSMPFQVAQSMMLAIIRRFHFGTEIEGLLQKMQAPQPPADPNAAKAQAEAAAMQQQMAQDKQKHDADMQMKQLDAGARQTQAQTQMAQAQMDLEISRQEHAMKLEELRRKNEASILQHNLKLSTMHAQANAAQAQAKAKATAKPGVN
jgi:hypothetical protein